MRPVTPLYPAPLVEPLALQNAPNYSNARGNRFEMPRPNAAQINNTVSEQNDTVGRPQLVTDGNQNPLLKIEGNSATIWQYTLATLSSLDYTIVGQSKMGMKSP